MNKKNKIVLTVFMVACLMVTFALSCFADSLNALIIDSSIDNSGFDFSNPPITFTDGATLTLTTDNETYSFVLTSHDYSGNGYYALMGDGGEYLDIDIATGFNINGSAYTELLIESSVPMSVADGFRVENPNGGYSSGILSVFSSVMAWFVSAIGLMQGIFVGNGLTFIGVLSSVGVGIAIGLLVFAIIRKFLELR